MEKPVPWITDWHHEACRVLTNGDLKGRGFLSHPHTIMNYFSYSPLSTAFCIERTRKSLPGSHEFAKMRHGDVILSLQ